MDIKNYIFSVAKSYEIGNIKDVNVFCCGFELRFKEFAINEKIFHKIEKKGTFIESFFNYIINNNDLNEQKELEIKPRKYAINALPRRDY